jgi:hypothetical protein
VKLARQGSLRKLSDAFWAASGRFVFLEVLSPNYYPTLAQGIDEVKNIYYSNIFGSSVENREPILETNFDRQITESSSLAVG